MEKLDNYVQIMVESLEKKSRILDRLIRKNESQADLLNAGDFEEINWSQFNIIVAEKDAEIATINEMDEGFQALYDRVGESLKNEKNIYAVQIKRMQELITELEEKSIRIRTGEERNRVLIEQVLGGRKKRIKQARTSLKTVSAYYKTMSKAFEIGPTAVDKKK